MKNQDHLIIKELLDHKEQDNNIASLAKICNKDYKTTYTIIKRLKKANLITLYKFGSSWKINLLPFPHPLIFEAEYLRQQEILKNKNLRVIVNYFNNGLKTSFFTLLLFGSYASHTQTKQSDIDLFFIHPDTDTQFEKKVMNITALIPLKLHPHVYSETEFRRMKNSKEITVGSETIKNNIILHGIETYYELIQ